MASVLTFKKGGTEGRPRGNDEWRTPTQLFERMNAEFSFALDAACSTKNKLVEHGCCWDEGVDGLMHPWSDAGGPVWCNPPYSNVVPWIIKATIQTVPVVMLLTADPSTRWWSSLVGRYADEVRFLVGRPRFLRPDGTPNITARGGGGTTTPCAIVVFRPKSGPPTYSYIPAKL